MNEAINELQIAADIASRNAVVARREGNTAAETRHVTRSQAFHEAIYVLESHAKVRALGGLPMPMGFTDTDGNAVEFISCASISGEADYVNEMPRQLRLRRSFDGRELEGEYVQNYVCQPTYPFQRHTS